MAERRTVAVSLRQREPVPLAVVTGGVVSPGTGLTVDTIVGMASGLASTAGSAGAADAAGASVALVNTPTTPGTPKARAAMKIKRRRDTTSLLTAGATRGDPAARALVATCVNDSKPTLECLQRLCCARSERTAAESPLRVRESGHRPEREKVVVRTW